mgnify:FL=1
MTKPIIRVVAGIWQDNTRQCFLGRRCGNREFAGAWEYPGGKVDLLPDGVTWETDEVALAREWQEELGLAITVGNKVWQSGTVSTPTGVLFCLCAYWVRPVDDRAPYYLKGSHSEVCWLRPVQILSLSDDESTPSLKPIAETTLWRRDWTFNKNVISMNHTEPWF